APPHPPRLARTTSPRTRGEVNKRSHSHPAIVCLAERVEKTSVPFSSIGTLFASLRHCQQREEQKRRQNADRRVTNCCTCRRSARFAGALACRRSTAALARETAGPQGSASGHASGDSPERSILYGRSNRGAEILRFACMIRKSGCRFSGKIMHHSRALPAPEQRTKQTVPVQ